MMRSFFNTIIALLMSVSVTSAQTKTQTVFNINKGINISAWLSQTSVTSGAAREQYFTRQNLQELASLGFDHIRLPFSQNQLMNSGGELNAETFALIDNVANWCKELNMRLILDCHQTAVHDFSKYSSITLFTDPAAAQELVNLWEKLSAQFNKYPNELAAYEILNEPAAKEDESWNKVQMKVYKAIRKLEPSRVILLGSNKANRTSTFPNLEYPKNDPNVILSFHFYYPYIITHYKADFIKSLKNMDLPLNYPGQLISDSVLNSIKDEEVYKAAEKNNGFYNKKKLQEMIQPAIDVARKSGLRLHCGEFGVNFRYPDRALLQRYVADIVSIFKENNIPWSYWGYRKEFGIFTDQKKIKDQGVLQALTQ